MPILHVSKAEFKAKALEFLRRVEETGERIIVTDHGRPTVELRLYQDQKQDPRVLLKGSITTYTNPMRPVGENDWETK